MIVHRIVNHIYSSNTFVLSELGSNRVWLVDAGDVEKIEDSLNVVGVFITHSHHDHIYGLNKLLKKYPQCIVYISKTGKLGLYSSKLNMSKYHEDDFIFLGENVIVLTNGDKVQLFDDCIVEVFETPGHEPSCLTYRISDYLFSGDAYIPGVKTVTTLRGGNKQQAKASCTIIKKMMKEGTFLCPGHGDIVPTILPICYK